MKKLPLVIIFIFSIVPVIKGQDDNLADPKNIALFPQQNNIRNTLNISGIWKFRIDSSDVGEKEKWYNGLSKTRPIGVPGSWNDQYEDIMNYFGLAWYEQSSYIPANWRGQRIFIRFGSATYSAKVWINGRLSGTHEGGRMAFAFDITNLVKWNESNRITVRVENFLKPERVPVGGLPAGSGMFTNNPPTNYDFFPFCGIERPVWIYSVPSDHISDITVKTTIDDSYGYVELRVDKSGINGRCKIKLEGDGRHFESLVPFADGSATSKIDVPKARLWSVEDPYLYKLTIALIGDKQVLDEYTLNIGIRTVAVDGKHILLNGKPVFLRGFGKHEDFPVFGKGTATPVIVKDYSLLKWIGANSFRTSHYPYDEEYMDMADQLGILIIDEIPAVGLYFDDDTKLIAQREDICKQQITELVMRDKNHPSIIMWSLANEARMTNQKLSISDRTKIGAVSLNFFKELFRKAKDLDSTRLTTIVGVGGAPDEWLGLSDVVCINRYYGWYTQIGNIAEGARLFGQELDQLYSKFHKPIVVTEFGADAEAGNHGFVPEMFTEEFQTDFIKAYLDVAERRDFVTGMHVWAFADFKTSQGVSRFGGINRKGVFTRDRRPKTAAFYLRSRWNNKL